MQQKSFVPTLVLGAAHLDACCHRVVASPFFPITQTVSPSGKPNPSSICPFGRAGGSRDA
ncbi:hypothetical protein p1B36 (plasmid) [Aromatoleum aromaticum EbN1]|uniref:Uncharacterized protein n=1 Tax=Aromatoleum aromaticum (strain DSM 19018 / LMG 30748 / EbN1) TaxID=76114 RepID=Q5NXD8_AROAE|nr:hypothetical protein p1B36 [Aromatoleum aromaticum EbN1]